MLKGIDVSSHNGWPFSVTTNNYYRDSDFIIVKSTQGLSYLYKSWKEIVECAFADGKLVGIYHYAGGNDAKREAEYFYNTISEYIGRVIPCIDFENYQNAAYNSFTWCYTFVNRFYELSGVWPMVYVNASDRHRVDNCAKTCALWLAGYPRIGYSSWALPRFNYKTEPWSAYTVWQYSSGPNGTCDLNTANLTRDGWLRIARGDGKRQEAVISGSDYEVARRVLYGDYGNGEARKAALGSRYDAVQRAVNVLLNSSDEELAKLVISGAFGNGDIRKMILGNRYEKVQKVVNTLV